jgi:pyrroline-5-carboxylate reductase
MSLKQKKIGFIGCGNMAHAIITGLIRQGTPAENITASNRTLSKLEQIRLSTGIAITNDNGIVAQCSDVIILSVKPQVLAQVCQPLTGINLSSKLVISIAAGVATTTIEHWLAQPCSIVRAMPNTPASILQAATGLYSNLRCAVEQQEVAESIFAAIGKTEWVKDESLINVVTAIAGSSPAYVFKFIEAMVEQATLDGLEPRCARKLATQAVLGAAKLAQSQEEVNLEDLTVAVTSPGGTTAAALASLEQNHFTDTLQQAVSAATNRGIALGQEINATTGEQP